MLDTAPRSSRARRPARIAPRRPRHAAGVLPRPTRSTRARCATIWHGGWLFAGFAFEIPNPGDFLTLDRRRDAGAGDPRRRRRRARVPQRLPPSRHAALPRGRRATCARSSARTTAGRTRGSGELVACHGMHDGVDKSALGLRPLHAEVVRGLIYVSLAESPPRVRRLSRAVRAGRRAAGLRSRAHRQVDRVRRRRQLEARLGEQPRVLPLHAAPSAVREVELRRRTRRSTRPKRSAQQIAGRARAHASAMGVPEDAASASERRARDVPRSRPRPLVHVQPHRARRGLRHRIDGRQARRAADGRLPGRQRRRAADAQPAEFLAARELRSRGRHADAAGRAAQDADEELLARRPATRAKARTTTSSGCCRSGTSPTSRTGRSASGSRRASTRLGYEPGPLSQRKEYNVDAFIRWYLKAMRAVASRAA